MQYIAGRKYEHLAEVCGETDENGVVPLKLLRNPDMMNAIGSVVAIVKVYCVRANEGDADAMDCCNKLDAAGREEVLFTPPLHTPPLHTPPLHTSSSHPSSSPLLFTPFLFAGAVLRARGA